MKMGSIGLNLGIPISLMELLVIILQKYCNLDFNTGILVCYRLLQFYGWYV